LESTDNGHGDGLPALHVKGYQHCTRILGDALRHFDQTLAEGFQEYLATETTVPHTMFFVHLDAPETIHLRKERDEHFDADSPSLAYWLERAAQDHR